MHGITSVISAILLLLIVLIVCASAFIFQSNTANQVISGAEQQLGNQQQKISTSFQIEQINGNNITVRNTGTRYISDLAFIVDNNMISYSGPSMLSPGATGNFLLDKLQLKALQDPSKLKITSSGWIIEIKTSSLLTDISEISNSCMTISYPSSIDASKDFLIGIQLNLSDKALVLMCSQQAQNGLVLQKNLLWNVSKNELTYIQLTSPNNNGLIFFNCSTFNINDRFTGAKDFSCVLDTSDSLSVVKNSGTEHAFNNYNRVRITGRDFYVDGNKMFFSGVNWADWRAYSSNFTRVDEELQKMHAAGINFLRIYIEKDGFSPAPFSYSDEYKNKLAYLINKAAEYNIFLELVPSGYWGSWVAQYYSNYWWTNATLQDVDRDYYYNFGKFLYDNRFNNIVYVSVMQEGSYQFDWYDPLSTKQFGYFYISPSGLSDAQRDWENWLAFRGKQTSLPMYYSKYEYANWVNSRFRDLIKLRAEAFRAGSNHSYYVGAQGGEGGALYDYELWGPACNTALKPDFWIHAVDVPEIHDYTPLYDPTFRGYWSYTAGFQTFDAVVNEFQKPVLFGEVNYNYTGTVDMSSVNAWPSLRQKLDFIKSTTAGGFAVWAWKDYVGDEITTKWGFYDVNFTKREIVDNFTEWNNLNIPEQP